MVSRPSNGMTASACAGSSTFEEVIASYEQSLR
jgi:hypothetical protein